MSELIEPSAGAQASVRARLIDCDVHPVLQRGYKSLVPYIPRPWHERFVRKGANLPGTSGVPLKFTHPNGAVLREDARAPDGGLAGSDPKFLAADLCDGHGVDLALLNCLEAASVCSAKAGVEESIVLASAYNDYFINEWLPLDQRFLFAMTVPVQDPQAAVAEIKRVGGHKQIAAISLPLVNIQMGNRWYWPIYAAAQEMGLPIFLHVTGIESLLAGSPSITAGSFDSYIDRYLAMPQLAESSVRNLVFNGIFERFPDLKFIFAEFGFLWVPAIVWRMDRMWRSLRHDVPWVLKPPSEYVRERCFFTTQPVDEPENPAHLRAMTDLIGYENICFSSDYPHWDNDMPDATLRYLDAEQRQKVFADNARKVLRL